MVPHSEVHPEVQEGCRECAHTPRTSNSSLDELLAKVRVDIPQLTAEQVAEGEERLRLRIQRHSDTA